MKMSDDLFAILSTKVADQAQYRARREAIALELGIDPDTQDWDERMTLHNRASDPEGYRLADALMDGLGY